MQVIILAAGSSSRFYPFNTEHKSEFIIAGKAIICYTIESLIKAGINNVVVVVSPKSNISQLLASYKDKIRISYVIQDEPKGAGNALILCEKYLENQFFLMNASHIDFHEFKEKMFTKKDVNVVLIARREKDASQYGILKVKDDLVLDIVEKPNINSENSNLRVIGIYLFKKEFIQTLKNTPDQHYQLESALSFETKKGEVKFVEISNEILTLKFAWNLFNFKNYILDKLPNYISKNVQIAKSVVIEGNVFIEDGVKILENAVIKGPCFIGKNSLVGNNALIRNKSCIEENVIIGSNIEIKNCLILNNTTTHSGLIEDSIIGKNCRIAAGILTANVRLDRDNIKIQVKGERISSGFKYFGIILGNKTDFGVRVTTMPGVIIGNNCLIGPESIVIKNIESNIKFYANFKEIIEKND